MMYKFMYIMLICLVLYSILCANIFDKRFANIRQTRINVKYQFELKIVLFLLIFSLLMLLFDG